MATFILCARRHRHLKEARAACRVGGAASLGMPHIAERDRQPVAVRLIGSISAESDIGETRGRRGDGRGSHPGDLGRILSIALLRTAAESDVPIGLIHRDYRRVRARRLLDILKQAAVARLGAAAGEAFDPGPARLSVLVRIPNSPDSPYHLFEELENDFSRIRCHG